MRQLLTFLVVIFMLSAINPAYGQTAEDEKIAKSLFLKASKAIREEDYQEAVKLLTQILDEYSESEVALQADEKLSEIADKAKISNLPKTPGFYWVETDGKITEMLTKDIKKGAPYEYGTEYAIFAQEEVPEIFADELSKFIVYRPKGDLRDVFWTELRPLMNLDEKGNQVPSGNNLIKREWEKESVTGDPFGSSKVVFEEIKPGMWEVGFPTIFSPAYPVACGLVDGTGQIGLLVVQSKMVHSFYPFLEEWGGQFINMGLNNYILKQRNKHPNNPDIMFFEAVMKYKIAYKNDEPQSEALSLARAAVELSQDNEITPKIFTDLKLLIDYCVADSVVRANTINPEDSPEIKTQKHSALKSYFPSEITGSVYWIQEQIARNHAFMSEYAEAMLLADNAVQLFKKKKPNTGTSLLGGLVNIKVEVGKPKVPEAVNIHDALTCYTLKPEWERVKDLKDEMESEQLLGEALILIESGGSDKAIEDALKKAKGKNNNNIRCYMAMADFYNKIGKPKDAENAQKDIKKANERMAKLAAERKNS